MLYEVLGDIWVVQRNPYLRTTCSTTQAPARLLIEALHHRLRRGREARRTPERADAARDAVVGELLAARTRAVRGFRRAVSRRVGPAPARAHACWAASPPRTTSSSTACRASRTSPTPPTGASSTRSSCSRPTPRPRWPALVQACIELGLTIIPRGGGTGYTGGAIPLTWKSAVINTEKLEAMSEVEMRRAARRRPQPVATVWTEAGVVTQRVADAAERAGFVFAVDPTSAEASLHRRQHRDERRRQEGGAVGHRARQPGVAGAWSRPTPSGWR